MSSRSFGSDIFVVLEFHYYYALSYKCFLSVGNIRSIAICMFINGSLIRVLFIWFKLVLCSLVSCLTVLCYNVSEAFADGCFSGYLGNINTVREMQAES